MVSSDFCRYEVMTVDKLYDVAGAAEKLGGISISTVRAWLTRGRLARTKIGRRTMVSERELERFIRYLTEETQAGELTGRNLNGAKSKC